MQEQKNVGTKKKTDKSINFSEDHSSLITGRKIDKKINKYIKDLNTTTKWNWLSDILEHYTQQQKNICSVQVYGTFTNRPYVGLKK